MAAPGRSRHSEDTVADEAVDYLGVVADLAQNLSAVLADHRGGLPDAWRRFGVLLGRRYDSVGACDWMLVDRKLGHELVERGGLGRRDAVLLTQFEPFSCRALPSTEATSRYRLSLWVTRSMGVAKRSSAARSCRPPALNSAT